VTRYLTPPEGIWAWMKDRKPLMPFDAATAEDARAWQRKFRRVVRRMLGPAPPRVPLNPKVLEEIDVGTYIRRKVVFDADPYASVSAYVCIPKDIKPGQKRPAVLAAHGHGNGKTDVCGIADSQERRDFITSLNYDYAHQLAIRGYVVIAPDWRGWGERESDKVWVRDWRDPCNVNMMAYGYLGYNLLGLQVNDGMRTIDYLCTLPEVDSARIGCVGLSFGGAMTTYLTALDRRIKVACVSGWLSSLEDAMSMRGLANLCG
jgi:cephalosporin-C deacetylase-like acetyl esterase